MGVDKAQLKMGGVPMIEIALRKLRSFCAVASIAGNREDLAKLAEIVHETRTDAGPAAGIEAGLEAAKEPWALFIPVDVPLVPAELLHRWCEEALGAGMTVSYLGVCGKQPAFCLLGRERSATFRGMLNEGERRLEPLLTRTAAADDVPSQMYTERELYKLPDQRPDERTLEQWFMNVNTPEDLAKAERLAR